MTKRIKAIYKASPIEDVSTVAQHMSQEVAWPFGKGVQNAGRATTSKRPERTLQEKCLKKNAEEKLSIFIV